jgi:pyruvate/2-oxoglutarate dehydrogenase complex dihydrolipoamide dehydrogenase (E3) component
VKTDAEKRTSNPKVFAAGDCARLHGHALTVTAAQDGKLAALAIARQLGVEVPAPARGVPTGRPILTQPPAPAAVGGASG